MSRSSKLFTPGFSQPGANALGQVFVDEVQMNTLRNLFETHPTIVAAAQVLESQILSSPLTLKYHGERTELTPEFRQHIDEHWNRFARDVLKHFIMYGFCVVTFEQELLDCATTLPERKRAYMRSASGSSQDGRASTSYSDGTSLMTNAVNEEPRLSSTRRGPVDELDELRRFVEDNVDKVRARTIDPYVVPVVANANSYRLAFEMTGRGGYVRKYRVYRMGDQHGLEADDEVVLFIRDPPDSDGNINSPMAAVYEISSFVDGLVNMAHVAEKGRAQPSLVTQVRKMDKKDGVNAQDMFFDTESREINRDRSAEENESHARATQMQLQLCRLLNQAQGLGMSQGLGSIGGRRTDISSLPANSFTLPADQEVAPHAPVPQTRTDLHDLMRLSVDYMCTAIGVPSSLIFEGRFAGRSTAQLSMLNSTVKSLATEVDRVLTASYCSIYNENTTDNEVMDVARARRHMKQSGEKLDANSKAKASDSSAKRTKSVTDNTPAVELVTTTSVISSVDEVLALYTGGVADFEAAAPLALNAIGLTPGEIEAALERREQQERDSKKEEKEMKRREEEDRKMNQEAHKISLEAQRTSLEQGKLGGEGAAQHLAAAARSSGGGSAGVVAGGGSGGADAKSAGKSAGKK